MSATCTPNPYYNFTVTKEHIHIHELHKYESLFMYVALWTPFHPSPQDQRVVEIGRHIWRHLCSKQGQIGQVAQTRTQSGFEYLHNLSGLFVSVWSPPRKKKFFSHLNEIYLCFGLCELNRQDCSVGITKQSLPSPPSLPPTPQQVFIHVDKISLSLPMQNKPSSLSLSSYEKMLQVPNHLHGPLLDSSSMSMSLSCWGAQNWT